MDNNICKVNFKIIYQPLQRIELQNMNSFFKLQGLLCYVKCYPSRLVLPSLTSAYPDIILHLHKNSSALWATLSPSRWSLSLLSPFVYCSCLVSDLCRNKQRRGRSGRVCLSLVGALPCMSHEGHNDAPKSFQRWLLVARRRERVISLNAPQAGHCGTRPSGLSEALT